MKNLWKGLCSGVDEWRLKKKKKKKNLIKKITDTTACRQQTRTTNMKTERINAMYNASREWSQHIRNKCKVENTVGWIKSRRQEWSKHETKISGNKIVKIAHNGKPTGNGAPGRSLRRCRDIIVIIPRVTRAANHDVFRNNMKDSHLLVKVEEEDCAHSE